jgi:hypothetical protein
VVIAFFAVLAILHLIGKLYIKPKPESGLRLTVRSVWFFCFALNTLICAFLVLFVVTGWGSPTSPLVFLIFFVIGFTPHRQLYKYAQRKRENEVGSDNTN